MDVEERALNAQLALSFTLTLTDEENIRQRLLEIRKTKLKRERVVEVVTALTEKFEKETDELGERNRAKEEEQKILLTRLRTCYFMSSSDMYKKNSMQSFRFVTTGCRTSG